MRPNFRWLLCVAILSVGCSRCDRPRPPQVSEAAAYLPKDVLAAVVVSDLGQLGDRLSSLQKLKVAKFAAQLHGFSNTSEAMDALVLAAGVDLRSREEMEKVGLDPSFGLGAAIRGDRDGMVILGAKDPAKLKAWIGRMVEQRLGAAAQKTDSVDGTEVTLFAPKGQPAVLALAMRERRVWLASGPSAFQIKRLVALEPKASLAQDGPYIAALKRLAHENSADLITVHLPMTSEWAKSLQLPGATVSVDLTPIALTVRSDVPWPHTQSSLSVLDRVAGPDLLSQLPRDAFLVARFGGDPSKLIPFLPYLVKPYWDRAFAKAKLNIGQDILSNLQSGSVLAFSLAPTVRLTDVPDLDFRHTNPFHYVQMLSLSKVKNAQSGQTLFNRLPDAAPAFGATMERSVREGKAVLLTHYAQGEGVHWALLDDLLVAGAPLSRFEGALKLTKLEGNVFSEARFALPFEQRAVVALLDLQKLSESIRQLPDDAWGFGGMFIRDAWLRWTENAADLRAISVSMFSAPGAVEAELALHLASQQ